MSGSRRGRRAPYRPRGGKVAHVGRPAMPSGPTPRRMRQLARQVRALNRASRQVDYDNPAAEAAHYALAHPILEAVIATPAKTVAGLRVKAEALAWCYGGQFWTTKAETTADRLLASMLRDLLAA